MGEGRRGRRVTVVCSGGARLSCEPAVGFWRRLRGLVGARRAAWEGRCLLFERCSSVHTFGMSFDLDIALVGEGRVLRSLRGVPPRRVICAQGARVAVERPASPDPWPGEGEAVVLCRAVRERGSRGKQEGAGSL